MFTEINQRAGLMDDETALQRLEGSQTCTPWARSAPQKKLRKPWFLICAEWVTGAMIDIDGGLGLGITADPAINQRRRVTNMSEPVSVHVTSREGGSEPSHKVQATRR